MWQRVLIAGVLGAGSGVPAALAAVPATAAADDGTGVVLTVQDPRITESSGLAASSRHPGVLYTHNDSGDSPRIYAIGPDGRTRAALTLRGAKARDWEGIAAGKDDAGRPALFVGDIGDNTGGAWPSITVYRVSEPDTLRDASVPATRFRFRYADGARDAEALLVDPRTNRLYIASKESGGGGLYAAPVQPRTDRVNVLRRVATVPALITDGGFAPDGSRFVLRGYLTARAFSAPGREVASFGLPLQGQGESATYSTDGASLLVGSEGSASKVWRVSLPAAARATAGSTPSPERAGQPSGSGSAGARRSPGNGESGREDGENGGGGLRALLALLVAGGASVLVIAAVRRGRR